MKFLAAIALIVLPSFAQGPGPTLEEIRDWSRAKLEAKQADFKKSLDVACKALKSAPYGSTSEPVKESFGQVAGKTALFPQLVVERMATEADANLRLWLSDALAATKDPGVGTLLLARATAAPDDLAPVLVRAAGRIEGASLSASLLDLAKGASGPGITAEALLACARRQTPGTIDIARAHVKHGDPRVRRAAVEALGMVGTTKDDIDVVRKLAVSAPEPEMRVSALRALGRFGTNLDALKVLHDAVGMADAATIEAALDALSTAGSKDLTPKVLLNVVRTGPSDLRLRAAKLMLALGNAEGVKAIVAKECGDADKETDDRDLQVIAGDRCREVGWWQGAIKYYDRALSLRGNAAQTNLVRVGIARCYARIRRFDDARKKLKEANYPNLRAFADDPDFDDMRESPAHRDLFK